MKVWFTPRARRRVQVVADWWRSNRRDAPLLFEEELERAIVRLQTVSATRKAIYETVRGKVVRRLLLPKTEQHVYFSVDQDDGVVTVHTVWGARRGRSPSL